jgi:hypothetical protein
VHNKPVRYQLQFPLVGAGEKIFQGYYLHQITISKNLKMLVMQQEAACSPGKAGPAENDISFAILVRIPDDGNKARYFI